MSSAPVLFPAVEVMRRRPPVRSIRLGLYCVPLLFACTLVNPVPWPSLSATVPAASSTAAASASARSLSDGVSTGCGWGAESGVVSGVDS